MGTFSKAEINTFNFIRWRSCTDVNTSNIASSTIATGNPVTFTNAYISPDTYGYYFPKILLGREASVYANVIDGVIDADFASWQCAVYDQYGTINSGHGSFSVTQDNIGGGAYRWYFSQTLSTSNFDSGVYYRFVIYNTSTNAVKYVSNFFEVTTDAESYAYVSYRNGTTLDGFNYTGLPSWRNKIAIDLNVIGEEPEIEIYDYPEFSTGDIQISKTYKKLVISFEANQFDYEARRALASLYACSNVSLNDMTLRRKDAPEWDIMRRSRTANGTISFYVQSVSEINLNN